MRKKNLSVILALFIALPIMAQSRITVVNGACSLVPPSGFTFTNNKSDQSDFVSDDRYYAGFISLKHSEESFDSYIDGIMEADGLFGDEKIYSRAKTLFMDFDVTRLMMRGSKNGTGTLSILNSIDLGEGDYVILIVASSQPEYLLADLEKKILSTLAININRVAELTGHSTEKEMAAAAVKALAAKKVRVQKLSDSLFSLLLLFFKEEVGITVPKNPAFPGEFGLRFIELSEKPFANLDLKDLAYEGLKFVPHSEILIKDFDIDYLCFPSLWPSSGRPSSIVTGMENLRSDIIVSYPFLAAAASPGIMPETTGAVLAMHKLKEPVLTSFLSGWYAITRDYRKEGMGIEDKIRKESGDYRSAGFLAAIPQLSFLAVGAGLAGYGLYEMNINGKTFEQTWGWTVSGGGLFLLGILLTEPTAHDAATYRSLAIDKGIREFRERYARRFAEYAKQFEVQFPGQVIWVDKLQ